MADRLNGYRILILETREEAQFSRLLAEQGADVVQCPMFTIHDAPDSTPIEAWIRRFIQRPCDDLVLMTGEGLRRLMKVVRRIGVEPEFIAALGKARKFSRCSDRGDKVLLDVHASRDLHQAAQPFTGHQHQIVARVLHETPDPRLDRIGIRRVMDGEHRTLQYIRALLSEQAGKLRFLARFQDQNAIAVQSVSHELALTQIVRASFILTPVSGLAQGRWR